MKKVLFVATVVKTHIMEFHIPYLKLLKELGWETHVAARNDYDDPSQCSIPFCDYYHEVDFARSPFSIKNIQAYRQLNDIISDNQYDVVHCHTPVGGALSRLVIRSVKHNKPCVIYTAHGFHFYKGAPIINWMLFYPVEKWLSRYTDTIITINKEDYERALQFRTAKVVYTPGVGIDVAAYREFRTDAAAVRNEFGIPEDAIVILTVGEINRNKNQQIIIKALSQLNDNTLYYLICGQGDMKNQYKQLVKDLHLDNNVIFAGYRTDAERMYKASDIFAFPSIREGLGLAAIEAMASGLPIITSSAGGIKEYSKDGITGYVVEDNKEIEYADAIRKLADDSTLREKMGRNNTLAAEQFDISQTLSIFKQVYMDLNLI